MRDINRIDQVLNQVGDVWKKYPDLRLGQLLLNCISDPMLYYIEDEKLVDIIKSYYDMCGNVGSN